MLNGSHVASKGAAIIQIYSKRYMEIIKLKLKLTNCYLSPINDNKYLLIDTGYEWEWHTFKQKLNNLKININDISYLLLTHHHDDHSGLVTILIEQNPDIIIILHHLCSDYLKLGKHVHPSIFWYINKKIAFILALKAKFDKKWTHSFPKYEGRSSDILIKEDISLKDLGINIVGEIIETNGHSSDHISLILDNAICICGDAAANFLQFAGTKYCIISLDDWDKFYKSWDKIINMNVRKIYPAHGKEFNIVKLQKNLRKNKKKNLVQIKG